MSNLSTLFSRAPRSTHSPWQVPRDTLDLAQAFRSMQVLVRMEVLLIGFDLELYAINELPAINWYLAEVTNPAQFADFRGDNRGECCHFGKPRSNS